LERRLGGEAGTKRKLEFIFSSKSNSYSPVERDR